MNERLHWCFLRHIMIQVYELAGLEDQDAKKADDRALPVKITHVYLKKNAAHNPVYQYSRVHDNR